MPDLYIIAGPNGAGKTTLAKTLLPEFLKVNEYVNADSIAAGLSPYNVEGVATQAGRLMLDRIHYLIGRKQSFAFETTLASRSFVSLIQKAKDSGYSVYLIYIWLESPELAIMRVESRVKLGGHGIPVETIRRRYTRSLDNFYTLYKDEVSFWYAFVNNDEPQIIASGGVMHEKIEDGEIWKKMIQR